eukprot:Gb_26357 [translate_table: standard]
MEGPFPLLIVLVLIIAQIYAFINVLATDNGFVQQTLDDSNIAIQKPYDIQLSQRYKFSDGVHYLWVYKSDKSHDPKSNTKPRTEIRIKGYDYTSGVWKFEGDVFIPSGTSVTSVMQVFGGSELASSLQLRVYDGELKRYNQEVLLSDVYDKWIHLSVIHEADVVKIHVSIDGEEKLVGNDRGKANHSFRCGVYTQDNASDRMESRWKNIIVWKKK